MAALCECGCGEPAPIARRSDTRKGWVAGRPMRFVRNHVQRTLRGPEPIRWQPVAPRFFEKVELIPFSECWEWIGKTNAQGYGVLWVAGKEARANRVSWEIHRGPIPDGMVVCHTCDRPSCVRPDHLFLGTQAENLADMRRKGRGSKPPNRWEIARAASWC